MIIEHYNHIIFSLELLKNIKNITKYLFTN